MIVRHSVFYFVSKVFPGIIEILSIAIYTRLLGENEYGIYALVLGGVLLLDVSLFSWMRLSLIRYWPKYEEKALLSTLLVLYSIVVIGTIFIGISVALFWSYSDTLNIIISALILLWTKSWFELHLESVRSRLEPIKYGLLSVTRSVISILGGVSLVYLGYGATGILIGMAGGNLLSFLILGVKQWSDISFRLSGEIPLKQFLRYGFPFTMSLSIGYLVNSADRYMIAILESVESSGLYAAGYDLPGKVMSMLYVSISLAATPLVLRSYERDGIKQALNLLRKYFILLSSIIIPSCIGIILLSENIATVFLGEEFRETAIGLLPWIAVGLLLAGFKSYYIDLSFQIGNRTKIQVWTALIAVTVNIGLNLWWIPIYGVLGAAYSTIVTFLVSAGISWVLSRSIIKLPFLGVILFKISIATIGMVIVLLPLLHFRGEIMLMVQILIGGLGYLICYVLLNISNSRILVKNMIYSK